MKRLVVVCAVCQILAALLVALGGGCGGGGGETALLSGPGSYECYAYIPTLPRSAAARQTVPVEVGETAAPPSGYQLVPVDVTGVLSRQGSSETRTYTASDAHLIYAELTPGVWDLTVTVAGYVDFTVSGLLVLPETVTAGLLPPSGAVLTVETPHGASVQTGATLGLGATISVNHVLVASSAMPPLTWSSSDTAVATVDSSGVVTGVSAGMATITCAAGATGLGLSDTVDVTVTGSASSTDWIYYDWGAGATWEIRRIRPDGTGDEAVISDAYHPSVSPDGATLAFTRSGDVYTVPTAGGTAVQLTNTAYEEAHLRWTPDGQHIVCTNPAASAMYRVSASDGSAVALDTTPAEGSYPTVSADSEYVVWTYLGGSPVTETLYRAPWATLVGTQLFAADEVVYPRFAWSGTELVYVRGDTSVTPTRYDVYVRDSYGSGTEVAVTADDYREWFPCLSPDGQDVCFAGGSATDTSFSLYRVTRSGGVWGTREVVRAHTSSEGTLVSCWR